MLMVEGVRPLKSVFALILAALLTTNCGGGGGGSTDSVGSSSPGRPPEMNVLAGHMGGPGNIDGVGTAARFWWPGASVTDPAGNVYVADTYNHVIRKVTPAGVVTTIAGIRGQAGADDGPASRATFHGPGGLAFDRAGNLYIADEGNYTVRRLSPAGLVVTVAGTPGKSGYQDGAGPAAKFGACWTSFGCEFPGLAVDSQGNVFYGDTVNSVIRRIEPSGAVTTFAGNYSSSRDGRDGTGAAASFYRPGPLTIDAADNLYVADLNAVRKVTPATVVTTLAGHVFEGGYEDGVGTAARLYLPAGLAVDLAGNIYAADMGNGAVRKITLDGRVTTLAGMVWEGSADGLGTAARFRGPAGISVNSSGQLYVSDRANNTIRRIDIDGQVTTFAGLAEQADPVDGVGPNARFGMPAGIVAAADGTVFVADSGGNAIRKIAPDGTTTTFAGALKQWGRDDGVGGGARFWSPTGLALGAEGTLYVSDIYTRSVRKVTPGGEVSTLAGGGAGLETDGQGTSATFALPYGIAVDVTGTLYVADTWAHTIRKITPDGTVSTFAGLRNTAGAKDGTGAEARFNNPMDVAVDASGNVFVADEFNHAIRKITPSGVVTTVAGTLGTAGWKDGVGAEAGLYRPIGITVASDGSMYVADCWNHTIRKITSDGRVTTVVGTAGDRGFSGDKLPGVLSFPWRVAIRGASMYLSTARGVAVIRQRP
jgi:sugar lactone lactonase YvrE